MISCCYIYGQINITALKYERFVVYDTSTIQVSLLKIAWYWRVVVTTCNLLLLWDGPDFPSMNTLLSYRFFHDYIYRVRT
jgi:hypothetical protein